MQGTYSWLSFVCFLILTNIPELSLPFSSFFIMFAYLTYGDISVSILQKRHSLYQLFVGTESIGHKGQRLFTHFIQKIKNNTFSASQKITSHFKTFTRPAQKKTHLLSLYDMWDFQALNKPKWVWHNQGKIRCITYKATHLGRCLRSFHCGTCVDLTRSSFS